jgi:hypothetical protein
MSVDEATLVELGNWDKFIAPRPEVQSLPQILNDVKNCNISAYCSERAILAASLGASMIAGCVIHAAEAVGPDGMAHPERSTVGKCNEHNYPPIVSWSLYAPGLHWYLTQFSRTQMLIFSMHSVLHKNSNEYVQEMLDFLQIPCTAHLKALSHSNSATPEQALSAAETLTCSVRDRLAEIYEPWNRVWYVMEPELDHFPPATDVPCRED